MVQRQESKEEEKKDPLAEGLKTTGEKLAEHKPFKDWYEPRLKGLKHTLWDKASPADKAAILTFLGLNLGTTAAAFSLDPKIRAALSGVNVGKPLGWIRIRRSKASSTRCPNRASPRTGSPRISRWARISTCCARSTRISR